MSSQSSNDDYIIKVPLAYLLIAVSLATAIFVGLFSYATHMSSEVGRLQRSEQLYMETINQAWEVNDLLLNRIDPNGDTARLRIRQSVEEMPSDR
jgi:hypothetical protein